MVLVTRYKDFSDASEVFRVPDGATLRSFFRGTDWKKTAVFINGKSADADTPLKEGDIAVVRSVPGATTTAVVIGIVSGIIAVSSAVAGGVMAYRAKKEAQRAKDAISSLSSSTSQDVVNLPYIKGASNTLATGKSQPYIIGRHLFTPYILNSDRSSSKGFHRISGTDGTEQYYNVILEGGFGKQILESMACDDVTVASLLKDSPQNGKFYFNADSPFAGGSSFIEIRQDGADFATSDFNKKVVEEEVSQELKCADEDGYEDLIYSLELNAMAADVCIMFNGLYGVANNGAYVYRTRNIVPSYSLDYFDIVARGGDTSQATWHEFSFEQVQVTDNKREVASATYQWTDSKHNGSASSWAAYALSSKASWVLVSGNDIRYDERATFQPLTGTTKKGNKRTGYIKAVITETTGQTTSGVLSNSFTRCSKSQLRFNAHVDFSFSDCFTQNDDGTYSRRANPIAVKVSTGDSSSTAGQGTWVDKTYVQYVQSTCFSEKDSLESSSLVPERVIEKREAAVSTLIGVRVKATSANEDKLGKINFITRGVARTWNSESKEWSSSRSYTENAAAWVLEILTSETHLPSKIDDSEIDLESFGAWYEYCEENALFVSKVLTSGTTKESVVSDLLPIGRAVLYENIYGQLSVAYDSVQENAVALFNSQNLISFSYEKSLARQPDGVKLTYIDASNGFAENTLIEMYDGTDSDSRPADSEITEINASGITSAEGAWQYAHYIMNVARARPRKVTAVVGKEGIYLVPYSKVLVQHSSLKIGLGSAVIKSLDYDAAGAVRGFYLYDSVETTKSGDYYAAIQCEENGKTGVLFRQIRHIKDGRTKYMRLYYPITPRSSLFPKPGDILSYGKGEETVTEPFIISGVEPGADSYMLTLYDYNEKIFSFGEIPEYESPLSKTNAWEGALPSGLPGLTNDDVLRVVKSYAHSYAHFVYCDDIETGENYSTNIGRKYIGIYTDGEEEDAATFEEANKKSGIEWSLFQGAKGEPGADAASLFIFLERTFANIFVDDDHIAEETDLYIPLHVVQDNLEVPYKISSISGAPSGMTVEPYNYKNTDQTCGIHIHVDEGTHLDGGNLDITVAYTEIKDVWIYGDEDQDTAYGDTSGDRSVYGSYVFDTKNSTEYTVGFSWVASHNAVYLGAKDSIDGFLDPDTTWPLHRGDWFTWTGTEEATAVYNGVSVTFRTAGVYKYNSKGYWEATDSDEQLSAAFSDTLAVANAKLRQNNQKQAQLLERLADNDYYLEYLNNEKLAQLLGEENDVFADVLAANTAFIGNLTAKDIAVEDMTAKNAFVDYLTASTAFLEKLVANTAFINRLFAKNIMMQSGGAIRSSNFNGSISNGVITSYGDKGWAIDYAGNVSFNNGKMKNLELASCVINGDCTVKGVLQNNNVRSYGLGYLYFKDPDDSSDYDGKYPTNTEGEKPPFSGDNVVTKLITDMQSNFVSEVIRLSAGLYLCLCSSNPASALGASTPVLAMTVLSSDDDMNNMGRTTLRNLYNKKLPTLDNAANCDTDSIQVGSNWSSGSASLIKNDWISHIRSFSKMFIIDNTALKEVQYLESITGGEETEYNYATTQVRCGDFTGGFSAVFTAYDV